MAKVVKEFSFKATNSKHQWDKWLDGQIWKLEPGKDFDASKTVGMRNQFYIAAKRIGKKVRVSLVDGCFVIQAY